MIEREITPYLQRLIGQYPVLTITGPRQSGKTTLCRSAGDVVPLRDFAQYLAALDPPSPTLSPAGVDI